MESKRKSSKHSMIMSPEEIMKMDEADKNDKEIEDEIDRINTEHNKTSAFSHVMAYNHPRHYIYIAVFFATAKGLLMPMIGVILSKLVNTMAIPNQFLDLLAQFNKFEGTGLEYFKSEIIFYSGMMFLTAFGLGLFAFIQFSNFGKLGSIVAFKIRKQLYAKILEMNIGWFD